MFLRVTPVDIAKVFYLESFPIPLLNLFGVRFKVIVVVITLNVQ